MAPPALSRRALLAAALAASSYGRAASAAPQSSLPPLKSAPFAVGAEITADQLADPAAMGLLRAQFSQVTPGLEMKMGPLLRDDGSLDFAKADAIAAFAARNGLRLHAHTLVWYIFRPASFLRVAGNRTLFENAYRDYILAVAGRYRGQPVGWDVVNEAVAEDGDGYRDCLWREQLGLDYIAHAFRYARQADPHAILFLNDYNLESLPRKRATFLRLVESLLKAGVPLGGLGTQMHMGFDQDPRAIQPMMRELASFGLPIHISEVDISTSQHGLGLASLASLADRRTAQARLVYALVDAFMGLPRAQRYAFTTWGLRDRDSWLRTPYAPDRRGDPADEPLLFDDAGRPKAATRAFVQAASRT